MKPNGILTDLICVDHYADDLPKWDGNSAKLSRFNAMGVHPVAPMGRKYKLLPSWECLGWAHAPYVGCASHAIVYRHQGEDIFWAHGFPTMEILDSSANCAPHMKCAAFEADGDDSQVITEND